MKIFLILGLLAAILCGCVSPDLETVSDEYVTQPPAEIKTICLELPEEAAEAVMEGSGGAKLYLCDGYELRLQTLDVQSLDEALRAVTGYGADRLTVMKTRDGDFDRYDCVWCTAGEAGEQVGRTAVFSDGSYFYCVSALADSSDAYELSAVWQEILDSVTLG